MTLIQRFALTIASFLLAVQGVITFADLAIPMGPLDEILTMLVTGAMTWLIAKARPRKET